MPRHISYLPNLSADFLSARNKYLNVYCIVLYVVENSIRIYLPKIGEGVRKGVYRLE